MNQPYPDPFLVPWRNDQHDHPEMDQLCLLWSGPIIGTMSLFRYRGDCQWAYCGKDGNPIGGIMSCWFASWIPWPQDKKHESN